MSKAKTKAVAEIFGYVGRKGSGKTYLMAKDLKCYKRQMRFIINQSDPTLQNGARITGDLSDLHNYVRSKSGGFIAGFVLG